VIFPVKDGASSSLADRSLNCINHPCMMSVSMSTYHTQTDILVQFMRMNTISISSLQ